MLIKKLINIKALAFIGGPASSNNFNFFIFICFFCPFFVFVKIFFVRLKEARIIRFERGSARGSRFGARNWCARIVRRAKLVREDRRAAMKLQSCSEVTRTLTLSKIISANDLKRYHTTKS